MCEARMGRKESGRRWNMKCKEDSYGGKYHEKMALNTLAVTSIVLRTFGIKLNGVGVIDISMHS